MRRTFGRLLSFVWEIDARHDTRRSFLLFYFVLFLFLYLFWGTLFVAMRWRIEKVINFSVEINVDDGMTWDAIHFPECKSVQISWKRIFHFSCETTKGIVRCRHIEYNVVAPLRVQTIDLNFTVFHFADPLSFQRPCDEINEINFKGKKHTRLRSSLEKCCKKSRQLLALVFHWNVLHAIPLSHETASQPDWAIWQVMG